MRRALVGWSLGGAALVAGVFTAALAAENRARGDALDRLERWCEAQGRKNELTRVANQRLENELLHGPAAPRADAPADARTVARSSEQRRVAP